MRTNLHYFGGIYLSPEAHRYYNHLITNLPPLRRHKRYWQVLGRALRGTGFPWKGRK